MEIADYLSKFSNKAELSEDGFIEYNFRIPDKLLNEPYKGLGQKLSLNFHNSSFNP